MSTAESFAALYVAMPTPFDAQGDIDDAALRHIVDYVLPRKVSGLALLTEAAEDAYLNPDERRQLVETIGSRVRKKVPLLVGLSSPATKSAIDLARHSENQGAQGFLVGPGRVPGLGYRELYRHVDRIGHATTQPLYLVLRPENALAGLSEEEQAMLAKHERVAGVFAPIISTSQLKQWARRFKKRENGQVFSGCALTFQGSARAGATGVICGLSMLSLETSLRFLNAIRDSNVAAIRKIEKDIAPAVDLLGPPKPIEELEGIEKLATKIAQRPLEGSLLRPTVSAGLIKAGLMLQGHPVETRVRPPGESPNVDKVNRLRMVMKSSGILS